MSGDAVSTVAAVAALVAFLIWQYFSERNDR